MAMACKASLHIVRATTSWIVKACKSASVSRERFLSTTRSLRHELYSRSYVTTYINHQSAGSAVFKSSTAAFRPLTLTINSSISQVSNFYMVGLSKLLMTFPLTLKSVADLHIFRLDFEDFLLLVFSNHPRSKI